MQQGNLTPIREQNEGAAGPQLVIWGTDVVVSLCKSKFKSFILKFLPTEDDHLSENMIMHEPYYLQELQQVSFIIQLVLNGIISQHITLLFIFNRLRIWRTHSWTWTALICDPTMLIYTASWFPIRKKSFLHWTWPSTSCSLTNIRMSFFRIKSKFGLITRTRLRICERSTQKVPSWMQLKLWIFFIHPFSHRYRSAHHY